MQKRTRVLRCVFCARRAFVNPLAVYRLELNPSHKERAQQKHMRYASGKRRDTVSRRVQRRGCIVGAAQCTVPSLPQKIKHMRGSAACAFWRNADAYFVHWERVSAHCLCSSEARTCRSATLTHYASLFVLPRMNDFLRVPKPIWTASDLELSGAKCASSHLRSSRGAGLPVSYEN